MPAKEDIIASLLRELVAYKEKGDEENVKAVEAELRFRGFKPEPPAKRAEIRPAAEPEKRGPGRPRKAAE
jgi:hypothetical protein